MDSKLIDLIILTPEKIFFKGQVTKVSFPGTKGRFMVLPKHAALISSLTAGNISYSANEQEYTIQIKSGFVEVKNNTVSACIEL